MRKSRSAIAPALLFQTEKGQAYHANSGCKLPRFPQGVTPWTFGRLKPQNIHINSSKTPMRFAQLIFTAAGIYGIAVLTPLYFLEAWLGRNLPPAVTHPEFYYGFVGVALAWQVVFLLIGREPVRFRPIMVAGVLEKLAYGVAVIVLLAQGRVSANTMTTAGIDLILGALFFAAYLKTPSQAAPIAGAT